jgi:hypothetical protein
MQRVLFIEFWMSFPMSVAFAPMHCRRARPLEPSIRHRLQ